MALCVLACLLGDRVDCGVRVIWFCGCHAILVSGGGEGFGVVGVTADEGQKDSHSTVNDVRIGLLLWIILLLHSLRIRQKDAMRGVLRIVVVPFLPLLKDEEGWKDTRRVLRKALTPLRP